MAAKIVIKPIFEADSQPCSYGFRPKKSTTQALEAIRVAGNQGNNFEETDGQGAPLADYIYLDGMPVATLSPSAGAVYFLHADRLGTPQAATDAARTLSGPPATGRSAR